MKLKYIVMLILAAVSAGVAAQNVNGTLSGHVTDSVDGGGVPGASVYLPELKTGVATDVDGNYRLSGLPMRKTVVQVSYVGHRTILKDVDLSKVSHLDFVLRESNAALDEVVITGLNSSQLMRNSPTPVSVITAGELNRRPYSNVIDAVAHQPGVSQVTTGAGISKPVIRGLGYNRVVVVNNGVRQEGQQWGDEHGVEVDAQTVGSVEILKGPASLMYGSDAMAGVLVLNSPVLPSKGHTEGTASTEYQSNNGLFGYSANIAGNANGFVYSSRYSGKMAHDYKNSRDGYVYGTGFRERAFTQLLGFNRRWGYSHLTFSYYNQMPDIAEGERDEQTGAFLKPAAVGGEEASVAATHSDFKSYGHGMPYQNIDHYKAVWDNTLFIGDGSVKLLLGYQQNRRQEYEDVLEPDECGLDFLLHTVNYGLRYLAPQVSGWSIAAGVNGMYQNSLNKGSEYLIPAYRLFDYGLFLTAAKDMRRWHFSGGVRFDSRHLNSRNLMEDGVERFAAFTRTFSGVTGSAGVTFNAADNVSLRFNLSRGFRAPNISELASNGVHEGTARYEKGNSLLRAENSWQADFGAGYSSSWLSVQLDLFASRIGNYIFYERMEDAEGNAVITDGVPTYRFAAGNARLLGGELMVDFHPVEPLHFENTFSYVDARQLNRPSEERHLPLIPAPRITSELRYDIIRDGRLLNNTYVAVGLECNLRQEKYYAAYGTETATPSYTLLNVSAGTDFMLHGRRFLTLVLTADNLTDRAYQSHLSRLKYTDRNNVTGRTGIFNMGHSVGVRLIMHIG